MSKPLAETAENTDSTESTGSIRQLHSPWMKAKEAAAYFGVSLEEVRRGGREYEKSNGRRGLKAFRRNRRSTFHVHHDDFLHWLAGNPPTRGTRKFTAV